MKSQPLGCLSFSALLSAALTLVVIGIVLVTTGNAIFSPGPLNAQSYGQPLGGVTSHAETGTDCAACHAAFWSSDQMTDRCIACHTGLMDQEKDFHIIMFHQSEKVPCQGCHTDHHGPEASLTRMELQGFPHDEVGFSLRKHIRNTDGEIFTCADCHLNTFSRPEVNICADCHLDYQAEFMLEHLQDFPGECLNCHDGHDRFSNFNHDQQGFQLTGMHLKTACRDCHQASQTLADLKGLPDDCRDCHAGQNPHGVQFADSCVSCHTTEAWIPSTFEHDRSIFILTGKHAQVACNDCHNSVGAAGDRIYKSTPTDCFSCHKEDEPHEGRYGTACQDCHTTEAWYPADFDHNLSVFKLEGWHLLTDCESCHTQTTAQGRPAFKGTPTDCFSCHEKDDIHAGELGTNCAECHTPVGWAPSTYDHARSVFQLTGAHLKAACQGCHTQDSSGRRIFKGIATACVSCHSKDDSHKGQFGTDCQACHTTAAWKPSTFDHSRTSFQLTGAHVNAACTSCHQANGSRQVTFKGTPTSCAACHAGDDAHKGQFGSDCQTCHSTTAWKPATFDHNRSSFQLTGAHVNVSCKSCHTQGWSGTPSDCAACHSEPTLHQGLFGSSCQSCHSTSAWRPASFNGPHSFPMNHGRATSCSDCHQGSYGSWTCYTCHNQNEITKKHTEEGIGDFSNCLRCHPDGRKEEGHGSGND